MPYSDVKPTDWYARTVEKVTRLGVMQGDTDWLGRSVFRPTAYVRRAEEATVALRVLKPYRYVLKRVRASVVGISSAYAVGTGAFVADDLILTNYHVVKRTVDGKPVLIDKFRICLCDRDYPPGIDRWLVNERTDDGKLVEGAYASVYLYDGKHACMIPGTGTGGYHDFALIQLTPRQAAEAKAKLGTIRHLSFLAGLPDTAEPVFSFGAPLGRYGWFAAGHVAQTNAYNGIIECLALDGGVKPGNSGGPVFTLEGLVAGIITWRITNDGEPEEMGLAQVGNTEVLPWLARHGITPAVIEDIPDEDE